MLKKYIVRLSDEERKLCRDLIDKPRASSSRRRRAEILLKCDTNGPNWTDARVAEAFDCRTRTVENIRQRLVTGGFAQVLAGKKRATPPRPKLLDGKQEAKIIAVRLGKPPAGFANWTLRLLAQNVVELEIVESISHETVRQTLKKTA
jgi:hypothetical protein